MCWCEKHPFLSIFGHRLSVLILVTIPKFKSVLVRKTNVGTVTINVNGPTYLRHLERELQAPFWRSNTVTVRVITDDFVINYLAVLHISNMTSCRVNRRNNRLYFESKIETQLYSALYNRVFFFNFIFEM